FRYRERAHVHDNVRGAGGNDAHLVIARRSLGERLEVAIGDVRQHRSRGREVRVRLGHVHVHSTGRGGGMHHARTEHTRGGGRVIVVQDNGRKTGRITYHQERHLVAFVEGTRGVERSRRSTDLGHGERTLALVDFHVRGRLREREVAGDRFIVGGDVDRGGGAGSVDYSNVCSAEYRCDRIVIVVIAPYKEGSTHCERGTKSPLHHVYTPSSSRDISVHAGRRHQEHRGS